MIAPGVLTADLEPTGFARLCGLASKRQMTSTCTISVLHDGGRVVHAVSSRGEVPPAAHEPFEDAAARAAELRALSGAHRVVLYDRSRTDELAAALVGNATPEATQLGAFWANAQTFWSSAAIATDPAPPPDPWPALAGRLAGLGDDWWGLLAVYDGEACAASLLAHFREGVVTLLTSLDHLQIERPARGDAASLLDSVSARVDLRLALLCDFDDLAGAMQQPELLPALAALRERAHAQRNLDILEETP